MKAPTISSLEDVQKEDPFFEKVDEVKTLNEHMKAKSFTIFDRNIKHINNVAYATSKKTGKMVNASEALRMILNDHEKGFTP